MKIVGIDPGLANFGVCVAELGPVGTGGPVFQFVDVWTSKPNPALKKGLRKMDDTAERVRYVAIQLHELLQRDRPFAICVEAIALPYGKIQMSVVSALGRIRGVIDALAEVHQLAVLEETPIRLKKLATGAAGASKDDVRLALEQRYPELRRMWPSQKTLLEHAGDAVAAVHASLGADVVLAARQMQRGVA